MTDPLGGIRVVERTLMPPGRQALVRQGRVVWIGPLGAPIEDAEFDTIIMSPADVATLRARIA